tara:strand:+ start:1790 stop:2218 length:429 start_codon:yes stop_codon:yes gene_type:complete
MFLYSCAKPKVINVILPEDENLNCEELDDEVLEAQKIKRDAEYAKEGTGSNAARIMLFWPAWAQTLHNADIAIKAANDRIYHLFKIMKKKECEGIDSIKAQITNTSISKNNVADQLQKLKEMYKSGDLTKEEYKKAKRKVLE